MAAAMAAAYAGASATLGLNHPLQFRGNSRTRSISIGRHGLCFNSLALKSSNNVVYGFSPVPRLRGRPFALAEQQASQTDVEDEEKGDGDVEDGIPQVNGADTAEVSQSVTEVLLRSYYEAVLGKDQDTMSSIQAQLLAVEKEKESLAQLVANLTEESNLAKERLLRLNADFDNFRKRSSREKDSLRENVKGDVIESLLPMIDNFERAKAAIKAETEGEKKIDSSYQGIYKQFVDIMKSLGVKVIDTVGKEFNPELHEAIMREESEEYKEGTVIQEFRRGFLLGDKLLRAAMVKVSAGNKPKAPAEETTSEQPQPDDSPQEFGRRIHGLSEQVWVVTKARKRIG